MIEKPKRGSRDLSQRGSIHACEATELLRANVDSAHAVVIHPPERWGVSGDVEAGEMLARAEVLTPVAKAAREALRPGGALIYVGESVGSAAWEFALMAHEDVMPYADIVVIYNDAPHHLLVRIHVKKGLRGDLAARPQYIESPVVVCTPAPAAERVVASQLPLELFLHLLAITTRKGDLVIDPFCGSGTVPLAAGILERQWVAGDIDEQTCYGAEQRLFYFDIAGLEPIPSIRYWVGGSLIEARTWARR